MLPLDKYSAAGAGDPQDRAAAVDRPFGDHLLESNGLIPILRRSIETGEAFADRELVLNLKSSPREPRIVDVTITPLEGEVTGTHLLLELTDTTARQRISRENEMLVRLDSSRMMLRQLAHEIKNPLGGLRGAAQPSSWSASCRSQLSRNTPR